MSNRSWNTQALVLSLSVFGEGHREAALLTEDHGLIHAAVFGGAKSKMRALVSPYHSGTAWLYTDPVKSATKITDFEVKAWRQGIRENLVRTWCAALCAEIITRSHGVADWRFANGFLDGISVSDENECRIGLLRYLWRSLGTAGIAPDITVCARCGDSLRASNSAESGGKAGKNKVVYYSACEDACLCEICTQPDEQAFRLSENVLSYLDAIDHERPSFVRGISLDQKDFSALRQFLFFLVSRMVGGPLKTLETGEGIL